MDCVVWASRKARSSSDQGESSNSSGEEDQESQIGDGILKEKEKEALRSLFLSNMLTNPQEEMGEIATTVEDTSEDEANTDDDQYTSNLRRAFVKSSPGCQRHQQISASILQRRVREKEEQERRAQQLHQLGRDAMVARGVPRKHADLLLMNDSGPGCSKQG